MKWLNESILRGSLFAWWWLQGCPWKFYPFSPDHFCNWIKRREKLGNGIYYGLLCSSNQSSSTTSYIFPFRLLLFTVQLCITRRNCFYLAIIVDAGVAHVSQMAVCCWDFAILTVWRQKLNTEHIIASDTFLFDFWICAFISWLFQSRCVPTWISFYLVL